MSRWYEQVVTRHFRDSSVLADALDAPRSSTDIVHMSIIGSIGCCFLATSTRIPSASQLFSWETI